LHSPRRPPTVAPGPWCRRLKVVTLLHPKVDPTRVDEGDAEALIREARRLRRRRWLIGIAVFALAGTASGVGVAIGGNGSRTAASGSGTDASAVAGSRSSRSAVTDAANAPLAVQSGLVTPKEGWVANGLGLYLTTNAGRTWSTITPPVVRDSGDTVGRMTPAGIDAVGSTHFWIPVSGIGLPGGECRQGLCRGSAIVFTANAGRTWKVSRLSDCLSCNISVSFVNDRDGFAAAGASTIVRTYATTDGGATWRATDTFTTPTDDWGTDKLAFTNSHDGWFVASSQTEAWLFGTTDGGAKWSAAVLPGLTSNERMLDVTGQRFFGAADGVLAVAVEDVATQQDHDVIYTTSDGGTRWMASVAPATFANSTFNQDEDRSPSFVSISTWYVPVGDRLYSTRNGGRSWTSRVPSGPWPHGPLQVFMFDFVTPATGWINLSYNSCGGLPRSSPTGATCTNQIALASTTSAGRHWTLLSSGSS
jgi:hypothetical protein